MFTKLTCFVLIFLLIFVAVTFLLEICITICMLTSTLFCKQANQSILPSSQYVDSNNWIVRIFTAGFDQLKHILDTQDTDGLIRNTNELIEQKLPCDKSTNILKSIGFPVKTFSSWSEIHEELDSSRNSPVWLVLIQSGYSPTNWLQELNYIATESGLRFAVFDCNCNEMKCEKWNTTKISVFISDVEIKTKYSYSLEKGFNSQEFTKWLRNKLSGRLVSIKDYDDLRRNWLQTPEVKSSQQQTNLVQIVAIVGDYLHHTSPLILAMLSYRFGAKIHCGIQQVSPEELEKYHQRFQTKINKRLPIFLMIRAKNVIVLNQNDPVNYEQMERFVRILLPESDICFAVFCLLNQLLCLNVFWTRCASFAEHFRLCLLFTFDGNLLYACLLTVTPLLCAQFHTLLAHFDCLLPLFAQWAFPLLRFLILRPFLPELLFVSFLTTAVLLALIRRKFSSQLERYNICDQYDRLETFQSVFNWIGRVLAILNTFLFRSNRRSRRRFNPLTIQTSSPTSAMNSTVVNVNNLFTNNAEFVGGSHGGEINNNDDDNNIEEQGEDLFEDDEQMDELIDLDDDVDRLLLERLFTLPNLWLHTELISTDYIHCLPVWHFTATADPMVIGDCSPEEFNTCSSSNSEYSDSEDVPQSTSPPMNCQIVVEQSESEKSPKKDKSTCQETNLSKTASHSNISSHIKAQIVEKKRKILRVRRKRCQKAKTLQRTISAAERKESSDSRPKWMLHSDQCTICLDSYAMNESIRGLACGHNYHNDCIVQWLIRGNHCCPICRWPSYRLKHPIQLKH